MASLVLALAACGGPAAKPDAAIDAPPDVAVDADTHVTGTWIDTYYETNGSVKVPSCTSAPVAIVVDPNTAQFTSYTGSCQSDGTFKLNTPQLASYYLRAGGELFATTAHSGLDLSDDHLGRPDVASAVGVDLTLDLSNLVTWANGDLLVAFSANTGFSQSLVFSSSAPAPGDTAVSATTPWLGYQLDSSKSDDLQIFQLATHQTTGGLAYVSLDRSYGAAPLTMALNTPARVPASGTDAFAAPTQSQSFLAVDAGSFDTFASIATPSTAVRTIGATIYASPTPDTLPSPPLVSFSQNSTGLTTLNFGNVRFGDPFPAGWQRRVRVDESFVTSYTFNGATGSLSADVTYAVPFATAQTGTLAAPLGPPTQVTIDGVGAFSADTISQTPVIAWSPPSVGVPTDYEITAFEVHGNGAILTFVPVLRLVVSDATSVRIPSGYMLGQRQYVLEVTSRLRVGIDPPLTPFHMGMKSATAGVLTALVNTAF
ncbi:MAG: hypothetical protein ACM31C_02055 [Acidobacteriota bacterium]